MERTADLAWERGLLSHHGGRVQSFLEERKQEVGAGVSGVRFVAFACLFLACKCTHPAATATATATTLLHQHQDVVSLGTRFPKLSHQRSPFSLTSLPRSLSAHQGRAQTGHLFQWRLVLLSLLAVSFPLYTHVQGVTED